MVKYIIKGGPADGDEGEVEASGYFMVRSVGVETGEVHRYLPTGEADEHGRKVLKYDE